MSYDTAAISRAASISFLPDSSGARTLQNNLEGIMQAPTITSMMFSSDDDNVTFPPGDLERVRHTYASFIHQQYASLPNEFSDSWELVVPVEIPADFNMPKLLSVEYAMKYASTRDAENATLQSDVVLTTASLPSGVRRLKPEDHGVYRDMKNTYGPRIVKKDVAWNLVTSFGIKPQGNQGWGHYIDHQRMRLGIRLTPRTGPANLYFILSVQEYHSLETVRSLAVEITSKWEDVDSGLGGFLGSIEAKPPRIVQTPPPRLAESRSVSPPSLYRFAGPVHTPRAPPQAAPVDVPIQAPRPEAHSRLRGGHVLYERFYAPPPECCEEEMI